MTSVRCSKCGGPTKLYAAVSVEGGILRGVRLFSKEKDAARQIRDWLKEAGDGSDVEKVNWRTDHPSFNSEDFDARIEEVEVDEKGSANFGTWKLKNGQRL